MEEYAAHCSPPLLQVMAPQVEGYGQAADIWSFGITLLEVATGRAPTARRSVEEILISVLSSPEDDPSSIAGELSHTPEVGHGVERVRRSIRGFRCCSQAARTALPPLRGSSGARPRWVSCDSSRHAHGATTFCCCFVHRFRVRGRPRLRWDILSSTSHERQRTSRSAVLMPFFSDCSL